MRMVRLRISRSSRIERCSMYQRSSSMRSSQCSSVRPLTCAQPVMPGLTARRPRWRSGQEAADAGDARVAFAHGEAGAHVLGAGDHGAQLEDVELLAVSADAALTVDR